MSGYTPVFASVFTGTLCGKWPDMGLWFALLALADKNGEIDCTPDYIATVTGMKVKQVNECIARFLEPDPLSRTTEYEGRRLEPVDPRRPWGWRIVNHSKYRERARKQAWDADRTASGRDAERKRAARAHVPTCPDVSRLSPLSDSDTNTDSDLEKKRGVRAQRSPTATRLPEDFSLNGAREEVAKAEGLDPGREFMRFCDYWRSASGARARKHDWDATWRNWCRRASDMRPQSSPEEKLTWRPTDEDSGPC